MSPVSNSNETDNPVYQTFQGISGCQSMSEADFPAILKKEMGSSESRGLLLGSGLPDEIFYEVLVDPEDFLQEVPLR